MADRIPDKPDDTIAWLTVRYHANGSLSVSGHLGDKAFALQLLDHARDAINGMNDRTIVMPNRDVALPAPAMPLRDVGDMPKDQRGDP